LKPRFLASLKQKDLADGRASCWQGRSGESLTATSTFFAAEHLSALVVSAAISARFLDIELLSY